MDFSRWQKRCWFSAFFYGRNQNIEFERDQKQKCWIQTKHSNCAQKMLPSVEACKSAERTINANEWKSGEMERKRANMFVLDLTIDTFQNIGNTLIHIFKVSQKLEQCWNQYQQYIYNGEFQEKTYCYNSLCLNLFLSPGSRKTPELPACSALLTPPSNNLLFQKTWFTSFNYPALM